MSQGASAGLAGPLASLWARYQREYRRLQSPAPDGFSVHDLRITAERLGAVLRLLSAGADGSARRLRKAIRATARRLGTLRDTEVHQGLLSALVAQDEGLRPLVLNVQRRHDRLQRALPLAFTAQKRQRLRSRMQALLARLRAESPARSTAPALAMARGIAMARRNAQRELREAAGLEPRRLHRLRLACKRFRYLLELASQAQSPPRLGESLRAARRWQNLLGEIHDLHTLGQRMRRYARRHPSSALGTAGVQLLRQEATKVQEFGQQMPELGRFLRSAGRRETPGH